MCTNAKQSGSPPLARHHRTFGQAQMSSAFAQGRETDGVWADCRPGVVRFPFLNRAHRSGTGAAYPSGAGAGRRVSTVVTLLV